MGLKDIAEELLHGYGVDKVSLTNIANREKKFQKDYTGRFY